MKFVVQGNRIFLSGEGGVLTTDNAESIICEFVLNGSFDGLDTYAIFYRSADLSIKQKLAEGACTIPWEVLQSPGVLYIGVYGEKLDGETVVQRTATNFAAVKVESSLSRNIADSIPPSPDIWEVYRADVAELAKQAQKAAEQADQDAESAAVSLKATQGLKENIDIMAENIEEIEKNVTASETNAQNYANAAKSYQTAAADLAAQTAAERAIVQQALTQVQTLAGQVSDHAESTETAAERAETAADLALQAAERAESTDAYTKSASDSRYANAITGEAEGSVVPLTDAWAGSCLGKCEIRGKTAETGTGDKSPSNPYDISGVVPTKVTVCGKNLLNLNNVSTIFNQGGYVASKEVNAIKFVSHPGNNVGPYFKLPADMLCGTFTFSCRIMADDTSFQSIRIGYERDGIELTASELQAGVYYAAAKICTKTAGIGTFVFYVNNSGSKNITVTLDNIQIANEPVVSPYEPYEETAVSLPEIEPLYSVGESSDSYDAVSGKMAKNTIKLEITSDSGTFSNTNTSPPEGYASISLDALEKIKTDGTELICNAYPTGGQEEIAEANREFCWKNENAGQIGFVVSTERLAAYGATSDRDSHVQAFQQYLSAQTEAGIPLTVITEKKESAATPHSAAAVRLNGNPACVYADQGQIAISYTKDSNIVIKSLENLIAKLSSN